MDSSLVKAMKQLIKVVNTYIFEDLGEKLDDSWERIRFIGFEVVKVLEKLLSIIYTGESSWP